MSRLDAVSNFDSFCVLHGSYNLGVSSTNLRGSHRLLCLVGKCYLAARWFLDGRVLVERKYFDKQVIVYSAVDGQIRFLINKSICSPCSDSTI